MAAFVFKAFTLSLKTIAKPLAGRFQTYVMGHPTFRGRVINLAQVREERGERGLGRPAARNGSPGGGRFVSFPIFHRPLPPLQRLHRLEVTVDRGAAGASGKAFVGDLTEEKAVELAGKVASEGFVWATAVTILGLEYGRQSRKDAERKAGAAAFRGGVMARADDAAATAAAAADAARAAAAAAADLGARLDSLERRVRGALEQAGDGGGGGSRPPDFSMAAAAPGGGD